MIQLPQEVTDGSLGEAPYEPPRSACNKPVMVQFSMDNFAIQNTRYLYLRTHGLKYSREASLQINGNATKGVRLMNPDSGTSFS